MSTEIFSHAGISIVRYAGPELPNGADRCRYQITNTESGQLVTMSLAQWQAIADYIAVIARRAH